MKNLELKLNSLQLAHKQSGAKCASYCACPGCNYCLCGKRKDAIYCCDLHRSEENNSKNNVIYSQQKENNRIYRANTREIKWLYDRGSRKFNANFLKNTRYDDRVEPVGTIVQGKKTATFDNIIMWVDKEGMFNLEKITHL